MTFVSRAGQKLAHAFDTFHLDPTDKTAADLGCSTGGFTDCMLQRGAMRVYAVDTGYGVLEWKLRQDPRVVVLERTNALHVVLPEPMDLVTIDAGWTKQRLILPNVLRLLRPGGRIISLVKPHYECADKERKGGLVQPQFIEEILLRVEQEAFAGLTVLGKTESPIKGEKGGNREFLYFLEENQGRSYPV